MPFISRDQIDPEVRKKFDAAHKARLRQTLSDLSLTKEQRKHLVKQLASVGQMKTYTDSKSKRRKSK